MKLSDIVSLDQLNEFESKHLLNSNGYALSIKAKRCELEDALYEGLISSYSISKVISTIHHSLDCQTKKLGNCFAVYGETSNFDFSKLLQILTQCGWYIAKINFLNKQKNIVSSISKDIDLYSIEAFSSEHTIYFELKVEAKFDIELEKKYWPSMLFCLAPSVVRHKIEQNGLVPKAGKNLDGQPERIYLGLDKHKLIDEMLPQLRINDKRYQTSGAILITIDCSKLPSNVRFFDDPNYSIDAVYTIVNIPAHCIHSIEEV
jgi:hypothetical protein